jgi:ELWxxDGT repeat protein
VLFNGVDSSNKFGLWQTTGTIGGTSEITAVAANPIDMTVFEGKVLFNALDETGHTGLWETDGTAGGTQEIAVAGAAINGLDPIDLTGFGDELLFNGIDASGNAGLWETDGTASGTYEITVAGADASGIDPRDFAVYDGEVLFRGLDQNGHPQLWVTDGTAAGTHELTVSGTSSLGLSPSDLVVYNGQVLFQALDASGHLGLWTTNGTTTHAIPTTSATGPLGVSPFDLTAIGGPELTAGAGVNYVAGAPAVALDAGLTINDPESSDLIGATISIGAGFLAGDALSVGSPQAGVTSNYNATTGVLTLSGSASLAAYQAELDSVTFASGSALNPSSRTITWSVNDSIATSAETSNVAVFVSNPDLDIMLQNTSGQLALWQASGATTPTISAAGLLGPNPGPSWLEEGSGAFFSGGASDASDLLFQSTDGSVAVWQMQGATVVSGDVVADPGASWRVAGIGDFNGDSKSDIALQSTNGNVAVWEMSGGQISQAGLVTTGGVVANPGPNWKVEATGDFNGDGKSDLVLQNTDGNVAIWNINGDQISQAGLVTTAGQVANPGPSWHVVGTGDLYGDGNSDIVLQNNSGAAAVWELNNSDQIVQSGLVTTGGVVANPGPDWHVAGTGDFNQDGSNDITLQNNNGSVAVWDMQGSQIIGASLLANPGPTWSVHNS